MKNINKNFHNVAIVFFGFGFSGGLRRWARIYMHIIHSEALKPGKLFFFINRESYEFLKEIAEFAELARYDTTVIIPQPFNLHSRYLNDCFYRIKLYVNVITAIIWLFVRLLLIQLRAVHLVGMGRIIGFPLIFRKIRIISHVASSALPRIAGRLRRKLIKKLFKSSDFIDVLSDSIVESVLLLGANMKQIKVYPCTFIDLSSYGPSLHKKNWVTFCGRFFSGKNPIIAVKAAKLVVTKYPNIHFNLLGYGPLEQKLRDYVKHHGLDKWITITYTENVHDYLDKSKVFLSIQKEENYPSQSLLEAMACGNAVIATDVGDTRRLVTEQNGILIRPDSLDSLSLSEGIINLLEDPELRLKMDISRKKALTHNPERYIEFLLTLYKD